MSNEKLCQEIIKEIGGQSNIKEITHCMTRLRIELNDVKLANIEALNKLEGTLGAVLKGNQVQVIIGNEINNVYRTFTDLVKIKSDMRNHENRRKSGKLYERVLNNISAIFNPLVPALAGSGLIKALLVILNMTGLLPSTSETYTVLSTISDAIFYFLPIALAYTSSKVFKCNSFIAVALAGTLMHPNFTNLINEGMTTIHFFGIPINLMAYNATVLPAVLGVWFMSYVERFVDRFIPKSIKIVFVPMITLIISIPITLMIVGPTAQFIGTNLSNAIDWLVQKGGIFAGIIYGALQPLIVVCGLQHGILPIQMEQIARLGYNRLSPISGNNNCAQAGACLGVMLRSKNSKTKSVAASACIGGMLGISEPAIYGVTLRLKKPFLAAMIGGACGGAFNALFQCQAYAIGGPSFVTLAMFMSETNPMNVVYVAIGFSIAFVVGAVLAYFFGFEEEVEIDNKEKEGKWLQLSSPVKGKIIPLADVTDPAFSSGSLGNGVAIAPESHEIYAPCDGKIETVFNTGHAIGIVTKQGVEVLIHLGIDTVRMKGQGFQLKVSQGDEVSKGQLLCEYDYEAVKEQNLDPSVIMVVTNSSKYPNCVLHDTVSVKENQQLLDIALV